MISSLTPQALHPAPGMAPARFAPPRPSVHAGLGARPLGSHHLSPPSPGPPCWEGGRQHCGPLGHSTFPVSPAKSGDASWPQHPTTHPHLCCQSARLRRYLGEPRGTGAVQQGQRAVGMAPPGWLPQGWARTLPGGLYPAKQLRSSLAVLTQGVLKGTPSVDKEHSCRAPCSSCSGWAGTGALPPLPGFQADKGRQHGWLTWPAAWGMRQAGRQGL